jgi:hypothetical protein
MVPYLRAPIRFFNHSRLSHFNLRLLHSQIKRLSGISPDLPLRLSPLCWSPCFFSWSDRLWLSSWISQLENLVEVGREWNGLIGSLVVWTPKKCLLVWLSARYWVGSAKSPKPECNCASSHISCNCRNGLGTLKSISWTGLAWLNGLQALFVNSAWLY